MEQPTTQAPSPQSASTRKAYSAPTVTLVPLVAEELLVASCVKTPNVCHFQGDLQRTKS